jgi:hypothetical protein
MEHNSIPCGFILAVRLCQEQVNQIIASQLELARLLNFTADFRELFFGCRPNSPLSGIPFKNGPLPVISVAYESGLLLTGKPGTRNPRSNVIPISSRQNH